MNVLNITLLQAAPQQGSSFSGILMIVLIFVIFLPNKLKILFLTARYNY